MKLTPKMIGLGAGVAVSAAGGALATRMALAQTAPRDTDVIRNTTMGTQIAAAGALYLAGAKTGGRVGAALGGAAGGALIGVGADLAVITVTERGRRDDDRLLAERESARAQQTIEQSRSFWRALGVTSPAVLGPIDVRFERAFHNAGYAAGSAAEPEYMKFGTSYYSGKSYAAANDVVFHEFAHRVFKKLSPGLGDKGGENGAVSESLGDTFAAAQDTKDWQFGEDAAPKLFRDMQNPHAVQIALGQFGLKKIPAPAHRSEYVETKQDNGGVHINAGIGNRAAFLIGDALGRAAMAKIYFVAVRNLPPNAGFEQLAQAVHRSTAELYGSGSREQQVVHSAWRAVGYDV